MLKLLFIFLALLTPITTFAKEAVSGAVQFYYIIINAPSYKGEDVIVLDKNKGLLAQQLFEDKNDQPLENTVFVIQYEYTITVDIVIPSGSSLCF